LSRIYLHSYNIYIFIFTLYYIIEGDTIKNSPLRGNNIEAGDRQKTVCLSGDLWVGLGSVLDDDAFGGVLCVWVCEGAGENESNEKDASTEFQEWTEGWTLVQEGNKGERCEHGT
jgi:hypothetical protein